MPENLPVVGSSAQQAAERAERVSEQTVPDPDRPAKRRGRPFPKGTSGNPGGKPRTAAAGGHPGRVPLLDDYRAVYQQDEKDDRTPGQRALRKLYEKSPEKFIANYTRLEEAAMAAEAREPVPAAPEEPEGDEGTERALALCHQILGEAVREREEEEKKFVRDGLCACCGQKPIPGRGEAGRIVARRKDEEERAALRGVTLPSGAVREDGR